MKKKKGFTLVELLAVIVILAVILVIAVPQIMSVIESARKGSIESTAKLIAEGAEREYTNRKILGKDTNIECSDVSSMNGNDYGSCVITFDNTGKATVKVTGKGKFEGYTCKGNSTNMECIKSDTSEPAETDAQYFSYSEVEGGVAITGYLAVSDVVNDVKIKDKNKCVSYLLNLFHDTSDEAKQHANALCSGNALDDGMTLEDAVQRGGIPSSDYETAGLEVTYNGGGTDVVIPSEIDGKKVVAIADYAFTSRGVTPTNISNTKKASISYLYNIDNKKKVTLLNDQPQNIGLGITSVVIPNTVTSIGIDAFRNNRLTEAIIPSSVTSIGARAFLENQLTSLIILDGVTSIGSSAFGGNQLTEVTIPGSVKNIGDGAFDDNKLTSITLSVGVTNIGDSAFRNNQITEVIIPSSVDYIGESAFALTCASNWSASSGCVIEGKYHNELTKIVNKTNKAFDWGYIINGISSSEYTFITGNVTSFYKENHVIKIVSE